MLDTFSDNALSLLKLFILLYADDTAILAESEGDLKNALVKYENYCNAWKLTVNVDKSKIIVFSKGRQTNYDFNLCGSRLEIVKEYKYLGILFNRSCSFYKNNFFIASQATKASFSLLKMQVV